MAALEPQYRAILKKVLAARFVPSLPPLLDKVSAAYQAAKQLSRAFSAFNANVKNRKVDIESALDSCRHIKLTSVIRAMSPHSWPI